MIRIIAYVDGFNLYYGLRDAGWKWAYWLNIPSLIKKLIRPGQDLIETKYFTSIVTDPVDKHNRQNEFLEALSTLPDLKIYKGKYLDHAEICPHCGYSHIAHSEKMTDVNIAVEMMIDAYQNRFDLAILISADSDLVGVIQSIRSIFNKRVIIGFPPKRSSKALKLVANGYLHIGQTELSKSLFPNKVKKPNGFILRRPAKWK